MITTVFLLEQSEKTYFCPKGIYFLWGVFLNRKATNKKLGLCTYGMLVMGAIVGCVVFFCSLLLWRYPVADYGLEDLHVLQVMNLPYKTYIMYICRRRFLQMILFIAIWSVGTYYIAAVVFHLFCGCYFGFLLADCFVKFGLRGIAYAVACFMPHYILLFLAGYLSGYWFAKDNIQKKYYYGNVNNAQSFLKVFVIFLLLSGAVFIEIKFQKNILNFFYQYLV